MKITHLPFFMYKFKKYYCISIHNNRGKCVGEKMPEFIYMLKTKAKPQQPIFE